MSGSGVRVKDAHWIRKQIARFGFDARVRDVTEDTCVLGLYGPKVHHRTMELSCVSMYSIALDVLTRARTTTGRVLCA